MRRRKFIFGVGCAIAWPLGVRAQQPGGRTYRIGVLETQSAVLNAANISAFREGLRELGYREGENLILEYRSADGRGERFPELVTELLDLRVDVIVTRGTPAALAAKNATSTVPIVMAAIGEPLQVVKSIVEPGGNITGLSGYTKDLEAKRMEVLHELVPRALLIAGLYNMGNPGLHPQWDELQSAAQSLGLHTRLFDVRDPADISSALNATSTQGVDALVVGIDTVTQENRKLIADLTGTLRLPAIYVSKEFVEAGGLISYGPNFPDLYRRAAAYVDKILNGARPAELPIEQPTKFELIVNTRAATALGLVVPPMLLARADEVIE